MTEPLLRTAGLDAWYGTSQVLQSVDVAVDPGSVVVLLGRNGVGKTTLVHALMGLVSRRGEIVFDGERIDGRRTDEIARRGLGLVPQGRRVFGSLSVDENLQISHRGKGDWTVERVYGLLPELARRPRQSAGTLSGGEQQMLALGRALVGNPKMLVLDEPFEGLAPLVIERIAEILRELKGLDIPALLVEQNLATSLALADEVLFMDRGQIVHTAAPAELRKDKQLVQRFMGVA